MYNNYGYGSYDNYGEQRPAIVEPASQQPPPIPKQDEPSKDNLLSKLSELEWEKLQLLMKLADEHPRYISIKVEMVEVWDTVTRHIHFEPRARAVVKSDTAARAQSNHCTCPTCLKRLSQHQDGEVALVRGNDVYNELKGFEAYVDFMLKRLEAEQVARNPNLQGDVAALDAETRRLQAEAQEAIQRQRDLNTLYGWDHLND